MAGLPATGDKNGRLFTVKLPKCFSMFISCCYVRFFVARRIEIFREPSTGLPLPFSLLSLAKFFNPNKFNSAKNLAPRVVVDDVYSGFIGHESHVMRRYLKLIGLSEESVMNALFDFLE